MVPLVAMGLVTVIEVISVSSEARRARNQTGLATATIGPNGLITALQNERNWASAQLVGVDQTLALEVSGYDETRAATDAAVAQFEAGLDHRGEAAQSAYTAALENLSELDQLRSDIDGYVATTTPSLANIGLTTELFDQYTALIAQFFGGMSRISIAMDDPELREGARTDGGRQPPARDDPADDQRPRPPGVGADHGGRRGRPQPGPAEIIEVAQLHNVPPPGGPAAVGDRRVRRDRGGALPRGLHPDPR